MRDIESALSRVTDQPIPEIDRLAEKITTTWCEPDGDIDHEVEDIFAVLDPDRDRFAEDYDEEFYDKLPQSTEHSLQDLVVEANLFNTVFGIARHDSIFRERLLKAVPRERSTRDFLRKLHRRRESCFLELDAYKRQGPLNVRQIAETSIKLREIIHKMSEYRQRVYENINPGFDRACARLSIKILGNVSYWNRDIYTNSSWLTGPAPPLLQNRNLFTNFISSFDQATINENHFIFHFLIDELPTQASLTSLRELTDLLAKFKEFEAPASLITKLKDFTERLRAQSQQPLSEIENYSSPASIVRTPRTESQSSNESCASSTAGPSTGRRIRRQPSGLEMPEAQRRRMQ